SRACATGSPTSSSSAMRSTPKVSARRWRYWTLGTTWPRRQRETWVSATPTERASWAWLNPCERMLACSQPANRLPVGSAIMKAQYDRPDSWLTRKQVGCDVLIGVYEVSQGQE